MRIQTSIDVTGLIDEFAPPGKQVSIAKTVGKVRDALAERDPEAYRQLVDQLVEEYLKSEVRRVIGLRTSEQTKRAEDDRTFERLLAERVDDPRYQDLLRKDHLRAVGKEV